MSRTLRSSSNFSTPSESPIICNRRRSTCQQSLSTRSTLKKSIATSKSNSPNSECVVPKNHEKPKISSSDLGIIDEAGVVIEEKVVKYVITSKLQHSESIEKDESSDLSSDIEDGWSTKDSQRLREVYSSLNPLYRGFWNRVAKLVGRSASDCQTHYESHFNIMIADMDVDNSEKDDSPRKNHERTQSSGNVERDLAATMKTGAPQIRKRLLKNYLLGKDQSAYNDDIFDSTPYRQRLPGGIIKPVKVVPKVITPIAVLPMPPSITNSTLASLRSNIGFTESVPLQTVQITSQPSAPQVYGDVGCIASVVQADINSTLTLEVLAVSPSMAALSVVRSKPLAQSRPRSLLSAVLTQAHHRALDKTTPQHISVPLHDSCSDIFFTPYSVKPVDVTRLSPMHIYPPLNTSSPCLPGGNSTCVVEQAAIVMPSTRTPQLALANSRRSPVVVKSIASETIKIPESNCISINSSPAQRSSTPSARKPCATTSSSGTTRLCTSTVMCLPSEVTPPQDNLVGCSSFSTHIMNTTQVGLGSFLPTITDKSLLCGAIVAAPSTRLYATPIMTLEQRQTRGVMSTPRTRFQQLAHSMSTADFSTVQFATPVVTAIQLRTRSHVTSSQVIPDASNKNSNLMTPVELAQSTLCHLRPRSALAMPSGVVGSEHPSQNMTSCVNPQSTTTSSDKLAVSLSLISTHTPTSATSYSSMTANATPPTVLAPVAPCARARISSAVRIPSHLLLGRLGERLLNRDVGVLKRKYPTNFGPSEASPSIFGRHSADVDDDRYVAKLKKNCPTGVGVSTYMVDAWVKPSKAAAGSRLKPQGDRVHRRVTKQLRKLTTQRHHVESSVCEADEETLENVSTGGFSCLSRAMESQPHRVRQQIIERNRELRRSDNKIASGEDDSDMSDNDYETMLDS